MLIFNLWASEMPWAMAAEAEGGISLSRTRVVYQSTDNAQTLTVQNNGSLPYLIQSAVVMSPDSQTTAPFITTPPMFRLEANSTNTLRILRKGHEGMPIDRESLFYFTAIAIPASAQPKDADTGSMVARVSVGIQNTIKLFYRPAGLEMEARDAEGRLTFRYEAGEVQVTNPTPYHLTLSRLMFDDKQLKVRESVPMIAPFSQASYAVDGPVHKVQWSVINDYGGNSRLYSSRVTSGEVQ